MNLTHFATSYDDLGIMAGRAGGAWRWPKEHLYQWCEKGGDLWIEWRKAETSYRFRRKGIVGNCF